MLVTNILFFSSSVSYPIIDNIETFWVKFILSSASAFNLVMSKMLLFGNDLRNKGAVLGQSGSNVSPQFTVAKKTLLI